MTEKIIPEANVLYQGKTITGNTLDRSKNLIWNFMNAVSQHPDAIAIEGDGTWTYAMFLKEVQKGAAALQNSGVVQGDYVGVYCTPTARTIALIYAVLYIGAVYVPIDASYPEERIRHICEKSKIRSIVSADDVPAEFPFESTCIRDILLSEDVAMPQPCTETELYAYCMFTSGTTGEPKGVPIRQAYLLNMCEWYGEKLALDTDSKLILLNNFGFDGSLKTIFTPLLYGSCIILPSEALFDVKDDVERIAKYQVTHLACVPSLMQGILEYCSEDAYQALQNVQYFISAGEKFRSKDILNWLKSGNCHAKSMNLYGPAECSCCVSYHDVTEEDLLEDKVPIGKPIYNKRMYILDESRQNCPIGTEGDIWIAGFGTFDGYIGMTREESHLYPDIAEENAWMYFSGDRGIRCENGEVLYCGSQDNQIKISGQRIEIEEIEQVLERHDNITDCGLCVKHNGAAAKIVMFYTTVDGKEMRYEELSAFMEKSLVKGVIPNQFVHLDKLPVTMNGKLDRSALETIDTETVSTNAVSADGDAFTQKLVQAWKNTLEIEEVPLDTGFFELGGYSMLLYHLQGEIKELLGKDITPTEILSYPTVRKMAAFLKGELCEEETVPKRTRRVRRTRK